MLPYCGAAPVPGQLWFRWNLDLWLIAALAAVCWAQIRALPKGQRTIAAAGWGIAALALISPICALSVALFSARIAQHMVLMLVAAPLIGRYLPRGRWKHSIWWSVAAFTAAIWAWHMPVPYEATFRSSPIYWSMHLTLFGSAIWLWRDLLNHRGQETLTVISAGLFACVQMGLLGAVLTFSAHPWFAWYATTTQPWGLTQLQDQQLGGVIMWIPSGVIFLAAASRSFLLMHKWLEQPAMR
jgi:putative membrane protein